MINKWMIFISFILFGLFTIFDGDLS